MLTERALESFKQFVETNIAYAMVEYGGTMHKAKILTRERLKDGSVEYFHYPGSIGDHNNYENSVVRYG